LKRKDTESPTRHNAAEASRREQTLCIAALTSGEYDHISDKEWVLMCEQAAREATADSQAREHLSVATLLNLPDEHEQE